MISIDPLYQGEDLLLILRETDPEIDITLNTYKGGIGKGELYYPFTFTAQNDGTIEILLDNTVTQNIAPGVYSGEIFQIQGESQFVITAISVRILQTKTQGVKI